MPYALITGASRGIGKGIALELAKRNYDLLLTARSEELLQKTATEIKEMYGVTTAIFPLDLSRPDAPEMLYNWCLENSYSISVLVNNAGFGLSGPFENHSLQQNADLIRVNISAPTQLCHLFIDESYEDAHLPTTGRDAEMAVAVRIRELVTARR